MTPGDAAICQDFRSRLGEMTTAQFMPAQSNSAPIDTREKLLHVLKLDLGFHDEDSSEMSHDFHAFPAKFPPQLPRLFIDNLTVAGDRVLDPMMGSGTCIVEAAIAGRVGIGLDIDPLATLLSKVKVTPINAQSVELIGVGVANRAEQALNRQFDILKGELDGRFDSKTHEFIDYWFNSQTQLELIALIREIESIDDRHIKDFLTLVFSAIIITKSGGVSQAWDLAHTRPHKLKQGVAKTYRPAIKEFRKRLNKNLIGLREMEKPEVKPQVRFGNAEKMPLKSASIDLIFTSPPYASNAIDYMRAHKFSLVWLRSHLEELSDLRSQYIGGESVKDYEFSELPEEANKIVEEISGADNKKGLALRRYYTEMTHVLKQSYRVLKPGKAAVFVVGTSRMRGIDSQTQNCLGKIGVTFGFELVGIATRKLDRDRRMLPTSLKRPQDSQIEERMHEEFIVALFKPSQEKV